MQTLNKKGLNDSTKPKDDFIDAINKPVKKLDITGISEGGIYDMLENSEPGQLQSITGEYLKMEMGERKAFKFVGMTVFEGDRGTVEAVQLIDREGKSLIAANTVIVNSLKRVTTLPTYCVIRYNGKKEGKSGEKYDSYDIEVLPQEIAK